VGREVEFKVRLSHPTEVEGPLKAQATFLGNYHKVDSYFRGPKGSFRLREAEGTAVVCRKEKTLRDGLEVNLETEFGVDNLQAFRTFARGLGYEEWYQKEKKGQAWRWGEVLIEVGTVGTLGWFAELEVLVAEDAPGSAIDQAHGRLREALGDLGLTEDRIEPKTYSELLGHRGR